MGKSTAMATTAFGNAWNFLKVEYKSLFADFLKVHLLTFAVFFLELVVLVILLLAFLGSSVFDIMKPGGIAAVMSAITANITLFAALSALIISIEAIFAIISGAISAVAYAIVSEKTKGKKVGIIDTAKGLFVPMGVYIIITWVAGAIIFAIPALSLISSLRSGVLAILGSVGLLLLFVLIWLVAMFFIQFAVPELVINRKSAVESIKTSIRLVKQNFWATLRFDILLVIVTFAISAVFGVIQQIVQPLFYLGFLNILLLVFGVIVVVAVLLVESVVLGAITISLKYFFWKEIAQEKKE